ncbi:MULTISPECIES: mechanosensitive ion channel family protein [unclassified Synechococcus]|uniref:mechanosensitive ion channel family protein n=1 Tax=unclassified Synechococcus TaxID=2626047 RepID=UPI001E39C1E4|nr:MULTISPECIES: mechanosensitive ion channel domain-containing protein [unclassified Synechococcus]WFN59292.1 mechanosensitive ion channel [Synechococcus sp. CCFWC 502]
MTPPVVRSGGHGGRLRSALLVVLALGMSLAMALPLAAQQGGSAPSAAPPPKQGCAADPPFVTLDGRKVIEIRDAVGAQKPQEFARRASAQLARLAEDPDFPFEKLSLKDEAPYTFIGIRQADGGFEQLLAVDDRAAACFDLTRQQLAERYRSSLQTALRQYRIGHSWVNWLKGTVLALIVLAIYLLWVRTQGRLNARLSQWIAVDQSRLLRGVRLGSSELVESRQVRQILQLVRRVLHWGLLLLISYLLIPLLLSLFPPTQSFAEGLRQQILQVITKGLSLVGSVIPNVLSILLILVITVYCIRGSNSFFSALDRGRIRIPGFYQEWALPTARLAAIFITLVGLVLAFPYIPGSDSKAFQGAGLLLGALAALGSSAIATNIISGLMLIYTRAFRIGDRVEINGTLGVVQERALLVTRIRTPRNELVSIPNAMVIGASVMNFSFSRREIQQPVALSTTITIGYDVPWRRVHELMLAAARSVKGITKEMDPFVLQTSLNDYHISYELTAYVSDPSQYRETLSEMLAALQDQFAAADVEILSPGYHAIRNGNASTVPKI